jgi:cell wall-associated NlpC family hydrolase
MATIGWLFIFAALVIIDAVRRGRADDLPEDVTDTFVALVTLDGAKLREVSRRTGEGLTADKATVSDAPGAYAAGAGGASGAALLTEARRLGEAAQGYSQNVAKRTGPDFYDCSGLVFRAAKNIGVYKGGSFNTQSFVVLGRKTWEQVKGEPQVGDVVLWQYYLPAHMGIVSGPDRYYSARSRKSGIGEGSISDHGGTPAFYRLR